MALSVTKAPIEVFNGRSYEYICFDDKSAVKMETESRKFDEKMKASRQYPIRES